MPMGIKIYSQYWFLMSDWQDDSTKPHHFFLTKFRYHFDREKMSAATIVWREPNWNNNNDRQVNFVEPSAPTESDI